MEEVLIIKLLLLLIMGILPLIFGLLPLKIVDFLSKTEGKRSSQLPSLLISILSCFAGGVVLAVSLIELFPEAREGLELLQHEDSFYHSYPLVELLVGAGFLLVYFVEEVFSALGVGHHQDQKQSTASLKIFPSSSDVYTCDSNTRDFNRNGCTKCCRAYQNVINYNSMEQTAANRIDAEAAAISQRLYSTKDLNSVKRNALVSAVTLVLAMSVHTSLEGFAFGVQDRLIGIYSLFFGVLIHKILVFFSIGISLTQSLFPRRTLIIILVVLLSAFSPLGGIVGILVETSQLENRSKLLAITILTSLSIGTFLYIALFEIISVERKKSHPKLLQWVGCTSGFLLMAVVLSYFSHKHTNKSTLSY